MQRNQKQPLWPMNGALDVGSPMTSAPARPSTPRWARSNAPAQPVSSPAVSTSVKPGECARRFAHPMRRDHHRRDAGLHVRGPAAIDAIAINLAGERVSLPWRRACGHNVEVAGEAEGSRSGITADARDQACAPVSVLVALHGEPAGLKPCAEGVGASARCRADCVYRSGPARRVRSITMRSLALDDYWSPSQSGGPESLSSSIARPV